VSIRVSERYGPAANSLFDGLTGKPLDPDAVRAPRDRALWAWRPRYARLPRDRDESRYGLALDARPNSQGPNYLRFGLSLQDDFQGNSTYNAAIRFVMADITRNAGEWVTDLQIGTISQISSELFLPLAQFSGWFVMPHAADRSRDVDVLQGQNLLAEYRVHRFDYGLDFGHQFGNWGEIRTGRAARTGSFPP